MKRKLIMVGLALGTVAGFGSGIASMKCRAHHRRAHFKQYVTDVCADAVQQAQSKHGDRKDHEGGNRRPRP